VNASPAKPSAIITQVEGSGTTASLMLAFDWPPLKHLEVEQRELKDFLGRGEDLRNVGFSRGRESDSTLILGDRRWIATGFEMTIGSGLRSLRPAAGRGSGVRAPTIDGF
jgi:hypothetical protein